VTSNDICVGKSAVLRSGDPMTGRHKAALALGLYGVFQRADGRLYWRLHNNAGRPRNIATLPSRRFLWLG
jgi:hypothetical protein